MKNSLLLIALAFSWGAAAQVFPMADKQIKNEFYYSKIFSPARGAASEWAVKWTTGKNLVFYTVAKDELKLAAAYDLNPKFYNIESGIYMLQLPALDRPVFIFVLNHSAPLNTLYLIDPKETKKPKYVLDIPAEEFDLSIEGGKIVVVYAAAGKKKRIKIDAAMMGIK